MEQHLDLELSTRVSELGRLRDELREWLLHADVDRPTGHDITLAIVEAFSNAVCHPIERASNRIHVHGDIKANSVTVTIEDDGGWRSPDQARSSGGYGLGLMKALMTALHIERQSHGTRVSLRRQLH